MRAHTYRVVPYVERLVRRLVNPLLDDIMPSFFSTLTIDEFNLGKRAPYIKSYRCYDGNEEDMILEWDLDLCSRDLRVVLAATLGGKHLGMPIKVYLTDLRIVGPLRLGFKWMPVAPHLKHMTISFLSVPEAKVKVKPVSNEGIHVAELPGLQEFVDKLVRDGLQHAMVEPNSIFWDVEKMWKGVEAETELVYGIFEKWKEMYGDPTPVEQPSASDAASAAAAAAATKTQDEDAKKKEVLAFVDVVVCGATSLQVSSFDLRIRTYCEVRQDATGSKFQTATSSGDMPQWREHCLFEITDWSTESILVFEVFDRKSQTQSMPQRAIVVNYDVGIGIATVDLRLLAGDNSQIHTLDLELEGVSTGRLEVKVCVSINAGYEAPAVEEADVNGVHASSAAAWAADPSTVSAVPTGSARAPEASSPPSPDTVAEGTARTGGTRAFSAPALEDTRDGPGTSASASASANIAAASPPMSVTPRPSSPQLQAQSPGAPASSPSTSSTPIEVSGFVFKRFHKDTGRKNWKRRFATVEPDLSGPKGRFTLRYFKTRQSDVPRGAMTLVSGSHCSLRISPAEMEATTAIRMPGPCQNGHLIVLTEMQNGSGLGALFLCYETARECGRWQSVFEAILPGSGSSEARSLSFLHSISRPSSSSTRSRPSGTPNGSNAGLPAWFADGGDDDDEADVQHAYRSNASSMSSPADARSPGVAKTAS